MKAARIHQFGPPEVISLDELPQPTATGNEVLVRVAAAGVGPWDAWIREGKSVVTVALPVTLGSDISGIVEQIGPAVSQFAVGDVVYGVSNANFTGGYAEYAVASENTLSLKPKSLDWLAAASAPVVAVTAWQMLFEYSKAQPGQSVLILGAAGSVGSYAVQLAAQAGLTVFATASSEDADYVRGLGAALVVDYKTASLADVVPLVDIVFDMVGGSSRDASLPTIKPGGILVSIVSDITPTPAPNIRGIFFLVEVTSQRLRRLTELFDSGRLRANVGTDLPLEAVRLSHEMLGGAPHRRGKIVLRVADLKQ
ncbi:NADP-dependent oxidoreductase [Granulicella sp. L46]|jgi:NADPH:quinone reductase-like Zn-dependent oxidoreductase|uniref:NADP-dependent oxidoreductase n=1 Tax=Granulicella sp. L46 TaxID=1641865 RepID=UPI00131E06D7|nr:NADP-dependent oxidoreductase [Granulicella sp. L46]